jgi:predicted ester cyclase
MTTPNVEFTIRNYFSLVDAGRLGLLGHLAAPGYVLHFAGLPDALNQEGAEQLIAGIQAAFPDLRHDIERIDGSDGHITVQITARGTQRGEFQGVPPGGRPICVPSTHTFRFAGGQIAEQWIDIDLAEIVRQISRGPAAGAHDDAVLAANKALVRRVFDEAINLENHAVIDEVFASDVIVHDEFTGVSVGRASFHQLLGLFDAAFPHHRVVVEAVIAEGDFVTVLHTHYATHTGQFMFLGPTGKSVVVNGLELFRVVDGRIVEFWRKDDDVSLLMQLGALSVPQTA